MVVVDSGSDDGTLDIVKSEDVVLEHIRKEDFSFGRSLNIGCRAASGEILVFISAHCYPEHEDWLRNLLAALRGREGGAGLGKQRGIPESHFSERQIFRRWFPEVSVPRQDGPFSNNANAAIRRKLWEQHPYDETLTGLEDLAWAQQVMREGWWVSYRADAGVVHVHHETPSQIRNRYRREAITFQKMFPGEHFNPWDFVRLSTRNVMADSGARLRRDVARPVAHRRFPGLAVLGDLSGVSHETTSVERSQAAVLLPRGAGVSVAGLIPMKGHSERVPRKNLRPIAGKPLFHWITETLLRRRGWTK